MLEKDLRGKRGGRRHIIAGRVRGVDGSCTKHLTVESYMVFYASDSYTVISFSSPTLSFIPDSSLFLQILPTAAFLFLLQD